MFNHNFLTYTGKIILQILGEILYFPIWWYSVGLMRAGGAVFRFWRAQEISLGFSVWVKNIFVPMYGQRDIASRAISFFMRLIQIIVRGFILIIWLAVALLALAFWMALPILLFLGLAAQIATY